MKSAAALICLLAIAGCTGVPPAPTTTPTPAPTVTPASTSPATPVSTADVGTTPFDGIWATEPLTKDLMDAALTRSGLDPSKFHPWFSDWTGIDYRTFTLTIRDGVWNEKDFSNGVWDGGSENSFTRDGDTTLVVRDAEGQCDVPFNLSRDGDVLNIELGADTCGDDDVLVETAIYQASPFHLIQAADWQPEDVAPLPIPSVEPSHGLSTSAQRVTLQVAGTVAGAPLGYIEYLPPSYSETGDPSPLIVFLHGSGESGKGDLPGLSLLSGQGIPAVIGNDQWPDDRPFVVLSPQHDDSVAPFYCATATEVHDFIAFALEHYNVDPTRIYASGLSCGAIGLWNYLAQYGGETLAAAVPIAGNGVEAFQARGCDLGSVPIWAFHGAEDGNVPIAGEVYPLTQLQACTSPAAVDARLTVFSPASHDVWSRTYLGRDGYDIYGWLLSHTKPG